MGFMRFFSRNRGVPGISPLDGNTDESLTTLGQSSRLHQPTEPDDDDDDFCQDCPDRSDAPSSDAETSISLESNITNGTKPKDEEPISYEEICELFGSSMDSHLDLDNCDLDHDITSLADGRFAANQMLTPEPDFDRPPASFPYAQEPRMDPLDDLVELLEIFKKTRQANPCDPNWSSVLTLMRGIVDYFRGGASQWVTMDQSWSQRFALAKIERNAICLELQKLQASYDQLLQHSITQKYRIESFKKHACVSRSAHTAALKSADEAYQVMHHYISTTDRYAEGLELPGMPERLRKIIQEKFTTLRQFALATEAQLMTIHGIGQVSVNQIREWFMSQGLLALCLVHQHTVPFMQSVSHCPHNENPNYRWQLPKFATNPRANYSNGPFCLVEDKGFLTIQSCDH